MNAWLWVPLSAARSRQQGQKKPATRAGFLRGHYLLSAPVSAGVRGIQPVRNQDPLKPRSLVPERLFAG